MNGGAFFAWIVASYFAVVALANPCHITAQRLLGHQQPSSAPLPDRLSVMTYNIAGLKTAPVKPRMAALANLFEQQRPHIAILQEVESDEVVQQFVSQTLQKNYVAITGLAVDVGTSLNTVLIRSDLGLDVRVFDSVNPTELSFHRAPSLEAVFKRTPMIVEIRKPSQPPVQGVPPPALILIAVHLKSNVPTTGIQQTKKFRERELLALRDLASSYQARFTQRVPMVIVGDLNSDLHTDLNLRFFMSQNNMHDALRLANPTLGLRDLATYTRVGHGQRVLNQLDGHLVNSEASPFVLQARVERFLDLNPSDHSPVTVIYDLSRL